jgi:uncharacterized protein
MNILVDICHPAHVHLYRNFIIKMKSKGHYVYVTIRDIPSAKKLLKLYNIRYIDYGTKSDSLLKKSLKQIKYDWTLRNIIKDLNIDFGIGTSITVAHASKLTKMISFILDDDDSEVEPLFAKFAHPFCDYLLSPDVLKYERVKSNCITYPGYHELAYLHPNKFNPDSDVLKELGIRSGEKYFIMRFNAFKAHHDIGVRGFSQEQKRFILDMFGKHGKVFITTESEIEKEFDKHRLNISPEKIFSALYYATMFIGDSQTMTNEAAVLGTPSIRLNSFVGRISYLKEQEQKYKLALGFKPEEFNKMTATISELLAMSNLSAIWNERRNKMLSDKIDVTEFLVNLIEDYPRSIIRIKKDSDYYLNFK